MGYLDKSTITVNLTPIGRHQHLFIQEIQDTKIIISNKEQDSVWESYDKIDDVNCYYTVYARRVDGEIDIEVNE